MVKLRLKRLGRSHLSYYRITVMDSRSPRDGRALEELGTYDPQNKDAAKQVKLDVERAKFWLGRGAQASDTVRSLLKKAGVAAS